MLQNENQHRTVRDTRLQVLQNKSEPDSSAVLCPYHLLLLAYSSITETYPVAFIQNFFFLHFEEESTRLDKETTCRDLYTSQPLYAIRTSHTTNTNTHTDAPAGHVIMKSLWVADGDSSFVPSETLSGTEVIRWSGWRADMVWRCAGHHSPHGELLVQQHALQLLKTTTLATHKVRQLHAKRILYSLISNIASLSACWMYESESLLADFYHLQYGGMLHNVLTVCNYNDWVSDQNLLLTTHLFYICWKVLDHW